MLTFTFRGERVLCCALLLAVLPAFSALAQNTRQMAGRVTGSADGQPLPGVSVTIKGTATGTTTDPDGRYAISVAPGATLIFKAIGFAVREVPARAGTFDLVLSEESSQLQEVTVVGVTIRKKDLTGSVGSVDSKVLEERPATNINQAIQGRVSGVLVQNNDPRPGGTSAIKVRGNNSIQFGANPIYVVDGLVMEDAFNTINPDDVASVDVLKDASATAIYGSRGANGVILITTKKGRAGAGKIDYNAWAGVQSFSKKIPYLNGQQIADLRIDAYANQYMDNNPGADRQAYINSLLAENSPAFGTDELDAYRSGQSYNWLDQIRRNGFQQNHTLSFSQGGEKGSLYVSLNYTDQNGLLKLSNYKRYGGQINLDQKIKPWFKIGTNTNVSRTEEQYIDGGVFNIAANANPLLAINDTSNYLSWRGIQSPDLYNPIRSLRIDGRGSLNRVISTNYAVITPIPGLNIRSGISVDLRNQDYFNYVPRDIGQSVRNSTQGSATQNKDSWVNWQWDNSVSYDKTIGKNNFSGLVSFGLMKNNYNYNRIEARGFATDDFSYKYLAGAYLKDQFQLGSDFVTNSLISYVARANYDYDGRYFATLTARYDGSSRFGNGNKWGIFPSLALAWNVAREDFAKDWNLDVLKLRAGYGIAGNQNIPNFAYRSLYRPVFTNNSVTYVSDGRLGNPDLRWEKQKQLNLGFDIALLKNRLSLSADYFIIHNDDLLMERTLSTTTGFVNTIDNVGSLLNKGAELQLNGRIISSETINWDLGLNISSYKNRVTRLYGNVDAIYNFDGFTGVEIQREGNLFLDQSLNSIYTYKFDKIAQESDLARIAGIDYGGRVIRPGDIIPVDQNGDRKIDDADRVVVGRTDPKFYGGFSTNFSYKNVALNAVFNYNYGGKRVNYFYEGLLGGTGEYAGHIDELDRWTPTSTDTDIPRAYRGAGRYAPGETDYSVQNASFLRLSVVTLSYSFSQSLLQTVKLGNLRLYVTGNNPFNITRYKGYDPEGGDAYPTARMIVAGIQVGL